MSMLLNNDEISLDGKRLYTTTEMVIEIPIAPSFNVSYLNPLIAIHRYYIHDNNDILV